MEEIQVFTYQTRIEDNPILDSYGELYGKIERGLFADIMKGKKANSLKSEYLVKYGITARQFNAIKIDVKGTGE